MIRASLSSRRYSAPEQLLKHAHSLLVLPRFRFEFHQYKYHASHSAANIVALINDRALDSHHAKAIKNGSVQNFEVGNYLLNLYVKSKNLEHAQKLFGEILNRDVFTWTILILGFARVGSCGIALSLFREMLDEGVCPNQFTLSSVFKCCSSLNEVRVGKRVHGWIITHGIAFDVVLANSLLDFYVKCGDFSSAKRLFESAKERDAISWNIMINAHLHSGDVENALYLFKSLPFQDVASWNTIIDGLMRNGFERTSLELLYEMVENGPLFNKVTLSIALVLVSSLSILELGKQIHGRVLKFGIHVDGFVRNSLMDMYCKCGKLEKASIIFRKLDMDFERNQNFRMVSSESAEIVSWSSMISGFVWNGEYEEAFKTFTSMIRENVNVDKFTVTSIISACASSGVLEFGRQVHACIQKIGHQIDAHLASSLIDMYAKCGNLNDAWMIFKWSNYQNAVFWSSMISGCALHGLGKEAVCLFENMMNEGITPNEVAFVGVLNACSHAGLVEEGCRYFRLMKEVYGIKPGVEHFTCMVDLFGRAGRLVEAKKFIHENGILHLSAVWRSFLSSCRLHKSIEMAKWVSSKLLHLEPLDAGSYILLANTCASEQRWDEAAEVRCFMQQRGVKKHPGQSWIQIKNQVHSFVMGDRSHPQDTEIYDYLDKLIGRLKEIGYSSDAKMVMQDLEDEEGEIVLGFHSEKLAIAYGIISTTAGMPIRIMKNLRVCNDCHNFIKYTSQLLDREIVVRDMHRFHHFKNGQCSCGDFW